eukprot:4432013-Prymnesium_polylepis.1
MVVATVGVAEYRRAALQLLEAGGSALEIGSHTGTSTAMLHDAAAARGGRCVGVDVSESIIKRA